MKELKSLYNGIMNDASLQRYSLGWKDITDKLQSRYKNIPKTDEQFEDKLIVNALTVAKKSLHKDIECFARELAINLDTLRNKYKH